MRRLFNSMHTNVVSRWIGSILLIGVLTACGTSVGGQHAVDSTIIPTMIVDATPEESLSSPTPSDSMSPTLNAIPSTTLSPGDPIQSDIPTVQPGEVLYFQSGSQSPDPCQAFAPLAVHQRELWAVSLTDSAPRFITTLCMTLHPPAGTVSPDGHYFAAAQASGWVVLDLQKGHRFDFGTQRELVTVQGLAWSADSDALYFSDFHFSETQSWFTRVLTMPPEEQIPQTILDGPAEAAIGDHFAGILIEQALPDGRLLLDLRSRLIPRLLDPVTGAERHHNG